MATDIIARGMAAQALKQSGGGGGESKDFIYTLTDNDFIYDAQTGITKFSDSLKEALQNKCSLYVFNITLPNSRDWMVNGQYLCHYANSDVFEYKIMSRNISDIDLGDKYIYTYSFHIASSDNESDWIDVSTSEVGDIDKGFCYLDSFTYDGQNNEIKITKSSTYLGRMLVLYKNNVMVVKDSNNIISTSPDNAVFVIDAGTQESPSVVYIDDIQGTKKVINGVTRNVLSAGSIKRFKNTAIDGQSVYILNVIPTYQGMFVATERSSGGSGALYRHKVMFGESLAEGQSHITFLNGNPTPYTSATFFQFLNQYISSQTDDMLIPEIAGWGNTALSATEVFNYTLSAVVISQDEIGLRVMGYPSMTLNSSLDDVIYHDFSQTDLSTDFSDTVTPCLNIGGDSTSEKVYEFELTTNIYDGSSGDNTPNGAWNKINAVITEAQFDELLTNINTAMSTSFTTPQEIIALYDSLKRDDFTDDMQTFYLLNGLIAYVCHYAIEREKPAIRTCWNGTNEDMKMVITNASVMSNGSGNIHHQYYSANVQPFTNNYFDTAFSGDISKMAFDTNSTLTITEKYETIGGGSSEDTGVSLLPINLNEFTQQSSSISTRTFTDSEIATLKSSSNVKVKLTGVYTEDTVQVDVDKNYALLTYTMRQEGTFGLEDDPREVNDLYYAGDIHILNMIINVYLIVNAISKVGTLIKIQALTSLNVNEGTNNFISFYAPTSLGSRGTVLVSTGDANDPFEWNNIAVRKKQVFFGYTSSTAKDISKVLQNNKLSTITYDYYNSLGRYIQHNLIYKFSWNLTEDTYELELYYIDGGQLVLLEPGVNTATAPHICIEYIEE